MQEPQVIFQGKDYIVFSKPAGMVVNNADTSKNLVTLQDHIAKMQVLVVDDPDSEFAKRGGIVHRLDKDTSGVILVALNRVAFENLQQQFKTRVVSKEYVALCHGHMAEEGSINVPIGRLPWNRTRFGVIPQGRESFTEFKTLEYKKFKSHKLEEELTLVKVFPKTGRTHQIRVHFQYIGHPIFADSLYSGRKMFAKDKKFLHRHFLHASKISFHDPISNEEVSFESPLSPELVDFLDHLT